MNDLTAKHRDGAAAEPAQPEQAAPEEQKIAYSMSPGLSAFLGANRIALAAQGPY